MAGIAPASRHASAASLLLIWCSSCIPYTLGSTAQTVPPHEHRTTGTVWYMPDATVPPSGLRVDDSNPDAHLRTGYDVEVRFGIDDTSDWGLRIPMASGFILSYRKRLAGAPFPDSAAVSWQAGGGVVNVGEHALFETSLLASSGAHRGVTWYGGARIFQTVPLGASGLDDQPSVGVTFGAKIAAGDGGVLPEVSVYHDPAVQGIRSRDIVIVPAISLHGSWLRELADILRVFGAIAGRR